MNKNSFFGLLQSTLKLPLNWILLGVLILAGAWAIPKLSPRAPQANCTLRINYALEPTGVIFGDPFSRVTRFFDDERYFDIELQNARESGFFVARGTDLDQTRLRLLQATQLFLKTDNAKFFSKFPKLKDSSYPTKVSNEYLSLDQTLNPKCSFRAQALIDKKGLLMLISSLFILGLGYLALLTKTNAVRTKRIKSQASE